MKNYQKALELLIRSQNDGRFSTDVRLYPGYDINRDVAPFLIMAYKKCGYIEQYKRLRNAYNQEFDKFEMRTWEIPDELDIIDRIRLKSLQKEMNALEKN